MTTTTTTDATQLLRNSNQARGIGEYAVAFLDPGNAEVGNPDQAVLDRTMLFFTDLSLIHI